MNALGRALAAHRAACARCTRQHACGGYLDIARAHTEPRQRWAGPVAAHAILSVRESPEMAREPPHAPAARHDRATGPGQGQTRITGTPRAENVSESLSEARA